MGLLAAGIVLFVLLMASYSERRTWIALGSATISIVLVFVFVFLSTGQVPSPVRQGLTRLAQQLPSGWEWPARDLAATVERLSTAFASAKKRAAQHEPIATASVLDWFGVSQEPEAEPEQAPASEPAPAEDSSDATITWFLDEPPPSETFRLSGANVSDQPLETVQAVLKPDSGGGELALVLEVDGADAGGAIVPPGARFHLKAETLSNDAAKQLGGAILSFGYSQAGRSKTSIMYLTGPMLAAGAASD